MGVAIPLLIIGDGEISLFAASYVRNILFEGGDPGTALKVVKAIGRFYDFYTLEKGSPRLDQRGMTLLVKQFYEVRRHGLASLGWPPVQVSTAQNDLRYITQFSLFCATNFGHVEANPSEVILLSQLSGAEFHMWMASAQARKKWDLLFHVFTATDEGQGKITRPQFYPDKYKRGKKKHRSVEHFPPQYVLPFILNGGSIRDRLCWLLLFFGGIRISELLHIFVRDITFNHTDGTAKVALAHPENGVVDWIGSDGKRKNGVRESFLREKYSLIPRNQYPANHAFRSGWKTMVLDNAKRSESEIHWTNPEMGRLFWRLHQEYMRSVRLRVADDHPYYFVSQRGGDFGHPLKLSNLSKQFYRCAERIGIVLPALGVHPHGARHFYGYYSASWLKLSIERVQKMMHHAQQSSTEVYYALDSKVMRDELARAHAQMTKSLPNFLKNQQLYALLLGDE